MCMKKTFRYRMRLSKSAETNLKNHLELCRQLYNLALEQRITIWKNYRKSISTYGQSKQLPDLKKAFPEFKQVNSQALQDVIERLGKAFDGFFRRLKRGQKPGFPRFRGYNRHDSVTLKQTGWKLEGKYLTITNIGKIKLFLSRPMEGEIKTVTICRTATGKWFVCFSCNNVAEKILPDTGRETGIDVGIKSFCVNSEGKPVDNPKHFRTSENLLHRRQRSLSRKKRGSNRRKKARYLVAKTHEKVSNQRKDFLHKTANAYIQNYDTIYIEDLKIKNMVKNRHLSKSISDSSWGMFFNFLAYKAEEAGRRLVKINPNGTSQICSGCGKKVFKFLSVRTHRCPFCGLVLDRDHNAAINILRAGQALQALTRELSCVV